MQKYYKILVPALVIAFNLISCNSPKLNSSKDGIIIEGYIKDYKGAEGTIDFMFSNPVDGKRMFELVKFRIDTVGYFKIDTILAFPQEIFTPFGSLYCSNGDSLFLEIENGNIETISGIGAKINQEIRAFDKYQPKRYPDSTKHLNYAQYIDHIHQREEVYLNSLARYIEESAPSSKSVEWIKDHITYWSWNDLLRYPWLSKAMYSRESPVPESYYAFLDQYDMNDFDYLSRSHILFLHEFNRYCRLNPKDSLDLANELGRKGDSASAMAMHQSMITNKTTGLTRELFLTKYYYLILTGKDTAMYLDYYDSNLISQEYFRWELDRAFEQTRAFLSNKQTGQANIQDFSDTHESDLLGTIVEPYKGTVIYVDFWAPWCGPCLREFPYSKKLQEHFEGQRITFLYLGNQTKEDIWRSSIANNQLSGEHVLLTDSQFAHLSKLFEIKGIPHYVLLDRSGKVVSKNAARPSSSGIMDILSKYLSEK